MKNKIVFFLIFLSSFSLFCSLLNSAIIEVNQDGSGDFTSIQVAIDNCVTGDTIWIRSGTYFENLFIDKSLSLVSDYEFTGDEEFISATVLDGNRQDSVIKMEGVYYDYLDVYICGFTIQKGKHTSDFDGGGGIYSEYVNLVLKKNLITNNLAYWGGGIEISRSNLILVGNTIKKNHVYLIGGGLSLVFNSSVEFDEKILNNI